MKIFFKVVLLAVLLCSRPAFSQLREIRQWQKVLPQIKDSVLKADALNRLGQLMSNRFPDSSYFYLNQAKNIAVRLEYTKGIADAYRTYGVLLTGENSYLAASYLDGALDRYRAIGNKEGESMVLMNIANLLYFDEDTTNAHSYLAQSYKIAQTVPKDSVLSIIINNINLHSPNFLSHNTDVLLRKGRLIAQKYKDERMLVYFKLFDIYRKWCHDDKDDANDLLAGALKSADSIGNEYVRLSIFQQLGFRATDTLTSLSYFKKGFDEASLYHFAIFKKAFAQYLYSYNAGGFNNTEAAKYAALLQEIRNADNQQLQKDGFSVVNYVRKDADLKLTRDKEQKSTVLLICFIGFSILAITVLFFVFRLYRVNKRYAAVMEIRAGESQRRYQEMENWNQFNNMLISVLAHDLRQPFSSIIMTSELLKLTGKVLTEEDLHKIVLDLNDTASKSLELLEGLLLWVKSKKENFQYSTFPILLQDNIEEANGLYVYDQQSKQVTLVNEIPGELVIPAHKQMLLFINRNLISNATKYSPKGGVIRIYTQVKNNEIIVAFEDQGPGMTKEQLGRLFTTGDTVNPDDILKGAGVALSVCYDMIKQMKGRLWVDSELGKGTTFFYALSVDKIQH